MSEIPTELLLPQPETKQEKNLYVALNNIIRAIADAINENMFLPSDGAYYLGGRETEGTWRTIRSGNDLVFQRYESSTWVTKSTITA